MVLSTKACGHNAVVAVDAGEEDAGGPLPLCRVGMMVCPPNNARARTRARELPRPLQSTTAPRALQRGKVSR